jgi:serine/threonine protein kinase/tetratricopeptide (TPR) repeat protein
MTGQRIGPYEVGEKLGEGGMGVVYCAHDTRLRRDVALKLLSGPVHSSHARRRFLREAQTASALNHPGIVTIHDIGEHEGEIYIVMEYVSGKSLRTLITPGGMDPATAVSQAIQIADALAAAHAAQIVHRDLKPGNLIVAADGRVKVLDFGLATYNTPPDYENDETGAHLTAANAFVGTYAYASPEQSLSRPVDHRSDIFSLAVVLHEMLTGDRPFEGSSAVELFGEITRGQPKRLRESHANLPRSLEALLLRMLEKNPADRIQSMVKVRESMAAIEREMQHRDAETATGNTPGKVRDEGTPDEIAIAVLRFRAIPQGSDAEAFSDALASETVQALGGIPRIRVASRLAASRFEDGKAPLSVVARALGVSYVLTGSVRCAGQRVRVLCELADAATGSQLWSHTYNASAADPFDAQEQIARSMAAAVSGALLNISAHEAISVPSKDLDAPALVRRAHMAVFAAYNRANMDEATELTRRAIAVSPAYAPAYAYLGLYLQQRHISGFSENVERDRAESVVAVERALQLAPADPEVLQNAGLVFASNNQRERAISVLRRAVEIAEFNLVAWGYLGFALGWAGDEKEMQEAHSIYDRLIGDTPDHPSMPYWLYFKAGICYRQGEYEQALGCTRRSVERQPHFLVGLMSLANALGYLGRYDEAREVIGRVLTLSPASSEEGYIRFNEGIVGPKLVSPHIGGLIAAGLFTGQSIARGA